MSHVSRLGRKELFGSGINSPQEVKLLDFPFLYDAIYNCDE
jgi:hypothetical protein